jgi:hypothetical protein
VIKFNIPDSGNVFISFPLIIYPFPEEATFYHDPVKIIQRSTVFPYTLKEVVSWASGGMKTNRIKSKRDRLYKAVFPMF